jgi:hypothetical protein
MAAVAESIVHGHGFSSPFWALPIRTAGGLTVPLESGPTALVPPVYPLFLAALLGLTGSAPATAAIALVFNVVCSSLICVPLAIIGARLRPEGGRWAAWTWALSPLAGGYTEAVYLWNTSLYTLVILGVCVLLADLPRRPWVTAMAVGAACWIDPAHILVVVAILAGAVVARRCSPGRGALIIMVAAAMAMPWAVRNSIALRGSTFLRSGWGMELHRGLTTDPRDAKAIASHGPARSETEQARFVLVGEHAYMTDLQQRAIAIVIHDPLLVLRVACARGLVYWSGNWEVEGLLYPGAGRTLGHVWFLLPVALAVAGFALRRRDLTYVDFIGLAVVLVFPLPYYVSMTVPRFRAPVDPWLWVYASQALAWVWAFTRRAFRGRRTADLSDMS